MNMTTTHVHYKRVPLSAMQQSKNSLLWSRSEGERRKGLNAALHKESKTSICGAVLELTVTVRVKRVTFEA